MNCLQCNIITNNPKFCCRSCNISYTNKLFPKRKPEGNCFICKANISTRFKYCSSCIQTVKPDWKDITLEECIKSLGLTKHSKIRYWSRKHYLENNPNPKCERCGYDKHVEVCHIKPIKEFPLDTKISVINSLTNLIGLCPNCHWEMDNK